jgi:hypothetical protein
MTDLNGSNVNKPIDADAERMLREAELLKKSSGSFAAAAKKKYDQSGIGKMQKDVTEMHRTFNHVVQAGAWVYEHVGKPLLSVAEPVLGWAWRGYANLWNKAAYKKDEYGDRQFQKKRAGMFLTATFAAVALLPAIAGGVTEFAWDAGLMAASYQTETMYLNNSQEIVPEKDIHSVQGCHTLPCTDQNSVYFRIKPTLMHQLWSLYDNGNMFFPDFVAASVPPSPSKCDVTYYGYRFKLFTRYLNMYPTMLKASCQPIGLHAGGPDAQEGAQLTPLPVAPIQQLHMN